MLIKISIGLILMALGIGVYVSKNIHIAANETCLASRASTSFSRQYITDVGC